MLTFMITTTIIALSSMTVVFGLKLRKRNKENLDMRKDKSTMANTIVALRTKIELIEATSGQKAA